MNEYTVSSAQDRANLIDVIRNLIEGKWTVKIYPWVQKKTTAQNRLLWKWNTEIGEHFGLEPEEMHSFLKEKFLLSILYRDDPGFARMADSIRNVKRYSKDDYDFIRKQVIDLVTTTKLNAKQMSEYLTRVKRFAMENGAEITIPPDKELEWLCGIS
jgi:Mg2+ and Co2+ transporter CorA